MKILFYGRLADALGNAIDIDTPETCTIARLRELVADRTPAAAGVLGARVRAGVGDQFVDDAHIVGSGETVEFLAPVSGG